MVVLFYSRLVSNKIETPLADLSAGLRGIKKNRFGLRNLLLPFMPQPKAEVKLAGRKGLLKNQWAHLHIKKLILVDAILAIFLSCTRIEVNNK